MNALLLVGALFLVALQPRDGTAGKSFRETIEAHDASTAKHIANARYAPQYRVYDVRRIQKPRR